jgi:hypothetical protein
MQIKVASLPTTTEVQSWSHIRRCRKDRCYAWIPPKTNKEVWAVVWIQSVHQAKCLNLPGHSFNFDSIRLAISVASELCVNSPAPLVLTLTMVQSNTPNHNLDNSTASHTSPYIPHLTPLTPEQYSLSHLTLHSTPHTLNFLRRAIPDPG